MYLMTPGIVAYQATICKKRGGSCWNSPAAFESSATSERAANCARAHYLKFCDAEQAALLLRKLGYTARYDGAQGMHFQRAHVHIWLSPDGALEPLGETRAAALAAWCVVAEHSQEVAL